MMTAGPKGRYGFRLATTSFIHRAGYAENVRQLAPDLDEIELLFLESDHLPSKRQIAELECLARQLSVTYNVHLPMDISLAHASGPVRHRSREAVLRTLERAAPLQATGYALHITFEGQDHHPDTILDWQATAVESLSRLLEKAAVAPRLLCAETLDFPPHWLAPVVDQMQLGVCVDVGHVVRFGYDLAATLDLFEHKIAMFHLHGVSGDQDHLALNALPPQTRELVARYLKGFRGSVCLEVFALEHFVDSMTCFEQMMNP